VQTNPDICSGCPFPSSLDPPDKLSRRHRARVKHTRIVLIPSLQRKVKRLKPDSREKSESITSPALHQGQTRPARPEDTPKPSISASIACTSRNCAWISTRWR